MQTQNREEKPKLQGKTKKKTAKAVARGTMCVGAQWKQLEKPLVRHVRGEKAPNTVDLTPKL
jgi:hypothetical protein